MSHPAEGEPFAAYPGPRISAGDPGATPGTDAWKAVVVKDPNGIPTSHIIDSGDPFDLEVRFRAALGYMPFPPLTNMQVEFHIHDLTGAVATGTPVNGATPVEMPTDPTGDHGTDGTFDYVSWWSSTAAGITLADGTYRITVHGYESTYGLMVVHVGTTVHVGN